MGKVIVKKIRGKGKGLFAVKNFRKGEIVNKWNLKFLTNSEVKALKPKLKHYVYKISKFKNLLIQPPERFVNHSCDPNTKVKGFADVAIKKIGKGDEITSDYEKAPGIIHFKCRCGSKNCRKFI